MSATESPDEQLKVEQLRKLRLEIEGLERKNRWWIRIAEYLPLITTIIAVAAFTFGIIQYRSNQEKEFKKSFLSKQLELYSEVSSSAARLAVLDDSDERNKEFIHFKELYHGNLRMVADKKVYDEVQSFLNTYMNLRTERTRQREIEDASRRLASICRESVQQTWEVPLQSLDLPKTP